MNETEIAGHLYNVAVRRAQHHKVKFGPGADADLRGMTVYAAVQIKGAAIPQQDAIRTGELLIERLVDEMQHQAVILEGAGGQHVIGEETLRRARSLLCPSWPLCP